MVGLRIDGIEELLTERRAALEASAAVRSRRQHAAEQVQRLTNEVREAKSRSTLASQERDELLANGSPESQARLRELRTKIGSFMSEIAAVQDDLIAARRYFDAVRNEAEQVGDRVSRAANRIYMALYEAFLTEAGKRLGSELIAAIGVLRYVLRDENDFFPKLPVDVERQVLVALKDEYFGDPPPATASDQIVPAAATQKQGRIRAAG